MSKQTIKKEVDAVICDFCDKEIDIKSDNYCYHHLRSSTGDVTESYRYNVSHFLFSWYKRKPSYETPKYIQYDFHAACFDNLMTKFLKEKTKQCLTS